eukprot:6473182-Amphidinium_carterae.3
MCGFLSIKFCDIKLIAARNAKCALTTTFLNIWTGQLTNATHHPSPFLGTLAHRGGTRSFPKQFGIAPWSAQALPEVQRHSSLAEVKKAREALHLHSKASATIESVQPLHVIKPSLQQPCQVLAESQKLQALGPWSQAAVAEKVPLLFKLFDPEVVAKQPEQAVESGGQVQCFLLWKRLADEAPCISKGAESASSEPLASLYVPHRRCVLLCSQQKLQISGHGSQARHS